jgi:hypothetical protein
MANPSFSSRLIYDHCAYDKKLQESTSPFSYTMYGGKFESDKKCEYNKYTKKYDTDIIDTESDLFNITRPASRCPSKKYNQNDSYKSNVVYAPADMCSIVYNNLVWKGGNGVRLPRNV